MQEKKLGANRVACCVDARFGDRDDEGNAVLFVWFVACGRESRDLRVALGRVRAAIIILVFSQLGTVGGRENACQRLGFRANRA